MLDPVTRFAPAALPLLLLLPLPPAHAESAVTAAPATITLTVDARSAPQRLVKVREQIPVTRPGPITLHYPRWLPGAHGPIIPPLNLAGLVIQARGRALPWRRDEVDMSAFHVEVPAGVASLEVSFDYLDSPGGASLLCSERLLVLDWAFVLLYPDAPDGKAGLGLRYAPRVLLPAGWKFAGALVDSARSGSELELPPVSLETLIDSPLIAGAFLRRYALPSVDGAPHEVDVAGDSAESVEAPEELQGAWRRLPGEALALFGARHYRRYHFLLALSDQNPRPGGLEHHESSDNKAPERFLLESALRKRGSGLLPHEFVHSWNGKYRRPIGLATPDFHTPMRDDLLWVYEGLTTWFGDVLTARSGLRSPELARDALALTASDMEHRAGRVWRPLQDTAIGAATGGGGPDEWSGWRRGLDYYPESELIWLEVDTTLRGLTDGKQSMDDFARAFHGGGGSGAPELRPYTFDDVVAALESLAHHDWRALLRRRLDETSVHAPLDGLAAAGWKLVWNDQENEVQKAHEKTSKTLVMRTSLGLWVKEDGTILDVSPATPAFIAGAAPGMRIRAVNGRRFTRDVMEAALAATRAAPTTIELLVESDDWFKTLRVRYHGGARHPHLKRVPGTPDFLGAIFAPRATETRRGD